MLRAFVVICIRRHCLMAMASLVVLCLVKGAAADELEALQAGLEGWYGSANFKCTYDYYQGDVSNNSIDKLLQMDWELSDPFLALNVKHLGKGEVVKIGDAVKFSINFDSSYKVVDEFIGADPSHSPLSVTNVPAVQLCDKEKMLTYEALEKSSVGQTGNELRGNTIASGLEDYRMRVSHLRWITPIAMEHTGEIKNVLRPFSNEHATTSIEHLDDGDVVVRESYSEDGFAHTSEVLLGGDSGFPYVKSKLHQTVSNDVEKRLILRTQILFRRFKTIENCRVPSRAIALTEQGTSTTVNVFDSGDLGSSVPTIEDLKLVVPSTVRVYNIRPSALPKKTPDGAIHVSLEDLELDDFGEGFFLDPNLTQKSESAKQNAKPAGIFWYINGVGIVFALACFTWWKIKERRRS